MSPVVRDLPGNLDLKHGRHASFDDGVCVMEAVAFVAGEPHSDSPECACPVISSFLRSWNDGLESDADRTRLLLPLVPKIVGTRATAGVEQARVMICIDWFCREQLPAWLDLSPSLQSHAATLRAAKPVQSWYDFDAISKAIFAASKDADAAWAAAMDARDARFAARFAAWAAAMDARFAAWDAAWAAAMDARFAAWDAARFAARDARFAARFAARAAARAAAWYAAWAATRAAAWDAARFAAWDAARFAAWDAALDAINPTKERLQLSAVSLVERMAELSRVQ